MNIQLVMSQYSFDQLKMHHGSSSNENLAFAYASLVKYGQKVRIIVAPDTFIFPAADCYSQANSTHVTLEKSVQAAVYHKFLSSGYNVLVNSHSHPFDENNTNFSATDDKDDLLQAAFLLTHSPKARFSLSLVFDKGSFAARLCHKGRFYAVDNVQLLSENTLTRLKPNNKKPKPSVLNSTIFSRQRELLEQNSLENIKIGLIGAGGLGSVAAETLVKLGATKLVLIDDDFIEPSNLNRLQGATLCDVNHYKADVLKTHLEQLLPNVSVEAQVANIATQMSIATLRTCDVLIVCVDNDIARYEANRLASQFLIPLFDLATAFVKTDSGKLSAKARLFTMLPSNTSCMECSQIKVLKFEHVIAASLSKTMCENFRNRGYLPADSQHGSHSVSIYGLNQLAAGLLSLELVRFFNQQPIARVAYFDDQSSTYKKLHAGEYREPPHPNCSNCNWFCAKATQIALPALANPRKSIRYKEWLEL